MSVEKKETVSIGLYPRTIRLLDEACRRERRSRSNLVETILLESLLPKGIPKKEEYPHSRPMARAAR